MKAINPDSAEIVLWIVDDDIKKPDVQEPILACLDKFIKSIVGSGRVTRKQVAPQFALEAPPGLDSSLLALFIYHIEPGEAVLHNPTERGVDILVYLIEKWEAVTSFLAGEIAGLATRRFWPHLVFSDLYRGILQVPDSAISIEDLPGTKFARRCVGLGILCFAYTSQEDAVKKFDYWWRRQSASGAEYGLGEGRPPALDPGVFSYG
jgi:hypothetical protein